LELAISQALTEAGLSAADLDLVIGNGCGWPSYDARELAALTRVLDGQAVGCVTGNVGLAESSGALFSLAAALFGLARGEAYPIATPGRLPRTLNFVQGATRPGTYRRALVCGSTERGANAALVVASGEAA
jgi:3-oxoacyl-(acyl-carrier-protein) synthase